MSAIIEKVASLGGRDLEDLCEATDEAILDGNGFGWLKPPPRRILEAYWKGVLLVPERELFCARLEERIVGSIQLLKPPPNNEAGSHTATLSTFFIAPWARGHGLARGLLHEAELSARSQRFEILDLDVRATQTAAIRLYENAGFHRWAVKHHYARIGGHYIDGYFYTKALKALPRSEGAAAQAVAPSESEPV